MSPRTAPATRRRSRPAITTGAQIGAGPGARIASSIALVSLLTLIALPASAQSFFERTRTRLVLGGGLMVSNDQVGRLHFDRLGFLGGVQVGYSLIPWVEAHVGFSGGAFPASGLAATETQAATPSHTGGLLAPTLGVTGLLPGPRFLPYLQLDLGPGLTGTLMRPYLRGTVGIDFRIAEALWLGPAMGYGRLFQVDEPGASTDAGYVFLAAALTFWPARIVEPEPDFEVRTKVVTRFIHTRDTVRDPAPPPKEPDQDMMALLDRALPMSATRVELLAPVLFEFDSDAIEPIGIAMLHEVAAELTRRPEIELVEIQGHADVRGSDDHNQDLSQRRALAVQSWLVEHGIAAERLQVAAHGEAAVIEQGAEEPSHQQTRRLNFRVVRMRHDKPHQHQHEPQEPPEPPQQEAPQ
jgi:OOP family OmpA-OmpF porin